MLREELLQQLETVSPALADNDLIPVLRDFWFSGQRVMAFNDRIAISAPCKTTFKGAVPGSLMMALLNASAAKQLDADVQGETLIIKAGRAKLKLPLRPVSSFVFEMPASDKLPDLPFDRNKFATALENLARSTSLDTSIPDQLGITLTQNDNVVEMFSTNDRTLSYAKLEMQGKLKIPRIILSASFCEQALRLMKDAKAISMQIAKDHTLLRADDLILFGRLIESPTPVDFHHIIDTFLPKGTNGHPEMPTGMKRVIDRACIATDAGDEKGRTEIMIENGIALLTSIGNMVEVHDKIDIKGKQPNVKVKVRPDLIKVAYDNLDHMLITSKAVIMSKGSMVYLISCGE